MSCEYSGILLNVLRIEQLAAAHNISRDDLSSQQMILKLLRNHAETWRLKSCRKIAHISHCVIHV